MKIPLKIVIAVLAIAFLITLGVPQAQADCGALAQSYLKGSSFLPQAWQRSQGDGVTLLRAAATAEPVVGLWKIKLTAKDSAPIPDDAVIDDGYAEWHGDGTEIMNSSRPPATGNFCLGVWKKTGPSTYLLNHFALSWDASGNFVGPANIREAVVVGPGGARFSGTFTLDQYDPAGNILVHIQGNIAGKRVSVNTKIGDVL